MPNLSMHQTDISLYQNHLEGLLKHRNIGTHPKSFWFSRSRWSPTIYIFNKLPGEAEAVGLGHAQKASKSYMTA